MKNVKRVIALIFVLSLSINTFGAVVSDNDGSAFITKAEFDALKKNFDEQINNYESSIDGKIDGAIASYLAGMQTAKNIEEASLINKCSPVFMKSKSFDKSHLGTYLKYYGSVCYLSNDPGTTAEAKNYSYFFEGTTDGWYIVKEKEINTADKEKLYKISEVEINGIKYKKIDNLIQSEYYASYTGAGMGGRQGKYEPSNDNYFTIPTIEVKKKTDLDTFGPNFLAFIPQNNGGSSAWQSENILGNWSFTDSVEEDSTLEYLAGNVLDSGTDINCLLNTDICKFGDMFVTVSSTAGSTRSVTGKDTGGGTEGFNYRERTTKDTGDTQGIGPYETGLTLIAYRHKITKLKMTDIINEKISNTVLSGVKFYEGCPIFTSSVEGGKVSVNLSFVNDENKKTTFQISNAKFPNVAVSPGCGTIEDCSLTTNDYTVVSGSNVRFTFRTKYGETYWIKALPEGGNTTITSISIINKKDQ